MTDMTVKKGSNLSQTVSQYNKTHGTKLTVAQVAKANHLKDANQIQAGQKLHFADGFESRKPSTSPTTKGSSTTPTKVGLACKEPNVVTEMMKKRQADMDKLFPKEPFKTTPFKLKF